jgi:hypothetical protein
MQFEIRYDIHRFGTLQTARAIIEADSFREFGNYTSFITVGDGEHISFLTSKVVSIEALKDDLQKTP